MFKLLLCISAVVLSGITIVLAAGAWAQGPNPAVDRKIPIKPTAQSLARAKEIYTVDCAVCHDANGDGKTELATDMQVTLADWTDPKTLASQSDEDLFKIIRDGKDKMPSEPVGRARDSEVHGLIQYIRSLAQQPAAAPAASN